MSGSDAVPPYGRYGVCLSSHEAVLPAIADLIDASYSADALSCAIDAMSFVGVDAVDWVLEGSRGRYTITVEPAEGYLFAVLEAELALMPAGRALLYKAYLQQGGNPRTQTPP